MARRPRTWIFLSLLVTVCQGALGADLGSSLKVPGPGAKVPVALAWEQDGTLLVALRDARRLAAVDPVRWQVRSQWELPIRPASLALADDRVTLLIGGMDGEILILGADREIRRTLPSSKGPTRLLSLPGKRVASASLWDGAVRVWDWEQGSIVATHPLSFAPGAMVRNRDGRLIVADAFGGHIANLVPGEVGSERSHVFDGVNLHALCVSKDGKELLIGHMFQFDSVPITNANIDWGLILSSKLSSVRTSDLDLDPKSVSELPRRSRLTLDGSVHGAADPSAMVLSPDGTEIFIALAGAHQVLKSQRSDGTAPTHTGDLLPLGHNQRLEVVEVGRTPLALVIAPSGRFLVTADAMSDTLTVLDRSALSRVATVDLNPERTSKTAAQRGEALFRDGRRALDRWMSCASCHPSGHTTGLNFDTQGDGGYGAPKNTPSLLGVARTEPYTWVGTFPKLSEQVHQSFVNSLKGRRPESEEIADLTAYLETLIPPPAQREDVDPTVRRGAELFHAKRCDQCHRPPLYTTNGLRDVGLNDEAGGHTRFNPPSLRGVAWTAPYLHDGRCDTLNEVLEIHPEPAAPPLTPAEIEALIAFLHSL